MGDQAIDSGPNPHYDPMEDALDAIAEHLSEDDSAYEDREEAEAQAKRILKALQERDLTVCKWFVSMQAFSEERTKIETFKIYAGTAPLDLMTAAEIQLDLLALADGKDPPSWHRK